MQTNPIRKNEVLSAHHILKNNSFWRSLTLWSCSLFIDIQRRLLLQATSPSFSHWVFNSLTINSLVECWIKTTESQAFEWCTQCPTSSLLFYISYLLHLPSTLYLVLLSRACSMGSLWYQNSSNDVISNHLQFFQLCYDPIHNLNGSESNSTRFVCWARTSSLHSAGCLQKGNLHSSARSHVRLRIWSYKHVLNLKKKYVLIYLRYHINK